jgi:hypothetical protein
MTDETQRQTETRNYNPCRELIRNPLIHLIGGVSACTIGYLAADGKLPSETHYAVVPAVLLFGAGFVYSVRHTLRNLRNNRRSLEERE